MAQKTIKKPSVKSKKPAKIETPVVEKATKYSALRSKVSKKRLTIAGCVVVALLFGLLLWQYNKTRAELKRRQNPQVAIQEEGESTQEEVSKVMVLPKSETPTVANISDISKLKDRPFFANAVNGDKVLIYKEAKKAIIYRPSTKQIVEVATYNAGDDSLTEPTQ